MTATTTVADLDDALQWCEDLVLGDAGLADGPPDGLVPLAEQDLLQGLGARAVAAVEAAAEPASSPPAPRSSPRATPPTASTSWPPDG